MIKELIIECEEITLIETNRILGNNISVTMSKVDNEFLEQLDIKEIVDGLGGNELMKVIAEVYGIEFIAEWHDNLGKS